MKMPLYAPPEILVFIYCTYIYAGFADFGKENFFIRCVADF